jgi:hypothetical protein
MRKEGVTLEHHADVSLVGTEPEHRRAADPDIASVLIGRLEPREEPERRGLAAARGTQQREELAGRDVEAHRIHRAGRAEGFADPEELGDRRRGGARRNGDPAMTRGAENYA